MSPMRRALSLLLLLCTPALADRVHLTNGRVLEGQVVREEGDELVVKVRGGIEARVPKSQVASVEAAATPEQTFHERRAALTPRRRRPGPASCGGSCARRRRATRPRSRARSAATTTRRPCRCSWPTSSTTA